jgi:Fe2+ or Zn2+ uptake regulation protein
METYLNKIKNAGFKATNPRIQVLKILIENKGIITARGIHQKLKHRIDLASVYRSLKILSDLKIIYEEKIDDQSFYYLSDIPHHHIICRLCGNTQCVPCSQEIPEIKNFKDITHQIILKGICNKCSNIN